MAEQVTETALDAFFALMMEKHFGAKIVTVPAFKPTPEDEARWAAEEAELNAMPVADLWRMWNSGEMDGEGLYSCDDVYAALRRRGEDVAI